MSVGSARTASPSRALGTRREIKDLTGCRSEGSSVYQEAVTLKPASYKDLVRVYGLNQYL